MVLTDGWNAVQSSIGFLYDISKNTAGAILKSTGVIRSSAEPIIKLPQEVADLAKAKLVHLGHPVVKIAALSGSLAVVLGAYGAHKLNVESPDRKYLYEIANKYHFYQTLALMGIPLSNYTKTASSFMCFGILLFCGPCYYEALTGDQRLKFLTPIGGTSLALGWISMVL